MCSGVRCETNSIETVKNRFKGIEMLKSMDGKSILNAFVDCYKVFGVVLHSLGTLTCHMAIRSN